MLYCSQQGDPAGVDKMGECSLEEFTSSLTEQGFELSSRGHNIYWSRQISERRLVIRQRVVRLERKNTEKRSHQWRLDSSYLISSQLHIAKNALDNLNSDRTVVLERRALVALHWLVGAIALGLVLSSCAIWGSFGGRIMIGSSDLPRPLTLKL